MCIVGYPQVVMIAEIKKTDITSLKKKSKKPNRAEKGRYIKGMSSFIKAEKCET